MKSLPQKNDLLDLGPDYFAAYPVARQISSYHAVGALYEFFYYIVIYAG
jgi:hypothetical protein